MRASPFPVGVLCCVKSVFGRSFRLRDLGLCVPESVFDLEFSVRVHLCSAGFCFFRVIFVFGWCFLFSDSGLCALQSVFGWIFSLASFDVLENSDENRIDAKEDSNRKRSHTNSDRK